MGLCVRRKFIAADTGIQEVAAEVDDDGRFHRFGSLGRHVRDFVIGEGLSAVVQRQAGDAAAGIAGKGHGHAAEPFETAGFGFRQQFRRAGRKQDINRMHLLSPGLDALGQSSTAHRSDPVGSAKSRSPSQRMPMPGCSRAQKMRPDSIGRSGPETRPARTTQPRMNPRFRGLPRAPEQHRQAGQAKARRKQGGHPGAVEQIVPDHKLAKRIAGRPLVLSGIGSVKFAADFGRFGPPVGLPFAFEQQKRPTGAWAHRHWP